MRAVGVIPARFASTRLKGKALADIHGKPMVRYVYEAARCAQCLQAVIVATDDERIRQAVHAFGGSVVMTGSDHASGTDRVAAAVRDMEVDVVVNVQGDEPLLDPLMIDECVEPFADPSTQMATVMKEVPESAYEDPGVVKVVCDLAGRALYFSRSLIPYPRTRTQQFKVFEHVGIYAYTKACLLRLAALAPTPLERIEELEQLRALEHGIPIRVVQTRSWSELISVDTPDDLARVRAIFALRRRTGPLR